MLSCYSLSFSVFGPLGEQRQEQRRSFTCTHSTSLCPLPVTPIKISVCKYPYMQIAQDQVCCAIKTCCTGLILILSAISKCFWYKVGRAAVRGRRMWPRPDANLPTGRQSSMICLNMACWWLQTEITPSNSINVYNILLVKSSLGKYLHHVILQANIVPAWKKFLRMFPVWSSSLPGTEFPVRLQLGMQSKEANKKMRWYTFEPGLRRPSSKAHSPPLLIKIKHLDFQILAGLFFISNSYFYPTASLSAYFFQLQLCDLHILKMEEVVFANSKVLCILSTIWK